MAFSDTLQPALNKVTNPKTDMYIDIAESISGILLVGFLWMHMLFVGTIIVSPELFDRLSVGLDRYYLAQIGIPATVLLILIHILLAVRRIPLRLRDMRIAWRVTHMINHFDTWVWLVQIITALIIGIMASIHIWYVMADWPIRSFTSALRVSASGPADPSFGGFNFPFMIVFYVLLLVAGEFHAGFGLYRIFVKWGWFNRHRVSYVLKTITAIIIAIGLLALYAFNKLAAGIL
jgi:fumarate reductase subunit C